MGSCIEELWSQIQVIIPGDHPSLKMHTIPESVIVKHSKRPFQIA
jgi:hypothetical protein